jgi:penicillin-binding protein 1A
MNQIYLGKRAYGFAAASEAYFGKPLKDLSIAEAAMLAGLPKAPSAYNPIVNPARAVTRQLHIIDRMLENGFISQSQHDQAKLEAPLRYRSAPPQRPARRIRGRNGAAAGLCPIRRRGLHPWPGVHTSIRNQEQTAAYRALRRALMDYERRKPYRGPEAFVDLPADARLLDAIDEALAEHPDNDDLLAAVVLRPHPASWCWCARTAKPSELAGERLRPCSPALTESAAPKVKIRRGAVLRLLRDGKGNWSITQVPEVEGAFVALDPRSGAIRALVGGFDFNRTSSTTSPRPGASRAPASSPSSTRRRWKRASCRPRWSTTRRCSRRRRTGGQRPGSPRTTTASSTAR